MLNIDTFSVREMAKVAAILDRGCDFDDHFDCTLMAAKELGITDDPDFEFSEADADRIDAWLAEV